MSGGRRTAFENFYWAGDRGIKNTARKNGEGERKGKRNSNLKNERNDIESLRWQEGTPTR